MSYDLRASVVELDLHTGHMVLEAEDAGHDIDSYLSSDSLKFDLEVLKGPESAEHDIFTISNLAARLLNTDRATYRLDR